MLVFVRQVGESIVIGDEIVVTVLGVSGHQIRIGTDAPSHVAVDREEVRARKRATSIVAVKSVSN